MRMKNDFVDVILVCLGLMFLALPAIVMMALHKTLMSDGSVGIATVGVFTLAVTLVVYYLSYNFL